MSDARDRVSGRLPFVLNERLPGMLHAALARSTVPHAEIRSVDVRAAAALPGVHAVLTAADLAAAGAGGVPLRYGDVRADQPVLAYDRVRFVGDPVAIVLADSPDAAAAASHHVEVDYAELPYVVDPAQARTGAGAVLHPEHGSNVLARWHLRRGDPDRALATADRVYDDTYLSPPASHVPMEPHVALAHWTADGRLRLCTSTQAPYLVRQTLAATLGCPPGQIQVSTRHLGGGYGAKVATSIEPVTAAAARVAGRPVRLELRRAEVFLTAGKHAAQVRLRTGVRADGRLVARVVDVVWSAGAYATLSADAAGNGMVRAPGPYHIPDVLVTSTSVFTNTVPSVPFRGAMTSQLCWAYESQLDDIAADLGMDPVELRRRNVLRDGDRYATGELMHDLYYPEILDAVTKGLADLAAAPPVRSGHARGTGVAIMIKSTQTPSRSECRLRLSAGGQVDVFTSSVEVGQGAHETIRQATAEALDCAVDLVRVHQPDTDHTPFDTYTASSRTTFAMTSAVRDAARRLRAQVGRLASGALGDQVGGCPDTGAGGLAALLGRAGVPACEATGQWHSTGGLAALDANGQGVASNHWHQGGVAVEVDVDLETGKIQVLRAYGASFAGRAFSPARVRQQNEGGMIFGLGPALFEELEYSDGQPVNPDLSGYPIPSILDIPPALGSAAIEYPAGVDGEPHGVGEMTVPPMAPAIGNAVRAACGIRVRQLPMTAERVLRALDDNNHPAGAEDT